MMLQPTRISLGQAEQVAVQLGIDRAHIHSEEFRRGLEVELEHGARDPQTNVTNDDMALTGKIAWAHLKEFPDYYARLDQMEAEADAYWASRRSTATEMSGGEPLSTPATEAGRKEPQ